MLIANVFFDRFSDPHFIHMQTNNPGREVLIAKIAFEQFANVHKIKILHITLTIEDMQKTIS